MLNRPVTAPAQWLAGARPRTLPAAVAPVLAGTGVAHHVDGAVWWKAALALVDRLGSVLGLPILGGDLVEAAAEYEAQITALVEDDDDTRAYVSSLEAAYDASMRPESSAELIEELENFLRDQ